jgi:hypothetical protein
MDLYSLAKSGCGKACENGGKCLSRMDIVTMGDLRIQFWGAPGDTAKGARDRALSIKSIFEDYHEFNVGDEIYFSIF